MTKSIYKTAKELGIKESERVALLKFSKFILNMEPDEVKKIPGDGDFRFQMDTVLGPDYNSENYKIGACWVGPRGSPARKQFRECGATGCIWGGAHWYSINTTGKSPFGRGKFYPSKRSGVLYGLFFPISVNMSNITPRHAALTTLHFLKTGDIDFLGNIP